MYDVSNVQRMMYLTYQQRKMKMVGKL